jgi:hypothetical protein
MFRGPDASVDNNNNNNAFKAHLWGVRRLFRQPASG